MFKSLPLLYSSHPSSYLFYFINQFIQRSKNTVAVVLVAWGGALMLVSRYFLTKNILNLVLTPGPSLRLETINLLGQVQHRQVPLSQVQVSSLLYLPSPSHPIPSHPIPCHPIHPTRHPCRPYHPMSTLDRLRIWEERRESEVKLTNYTEDGHRGDSKEGSVYQGEDRWRHVFYGQGWCSAR